MSICSQSCATSNETRSGLVPRAEAWTWSSLQWLALPDKAPVRLDPGTVPRGGEWVEGVNAAITEAEVERVRVCVRRDRPFGSEEWTKATARSLGLVSSLRPRGRPPAVDSTTS